MVESRVDGAGVNEVGQAELLHAPEPLKGSGIEQAKGHRLDPDVVPNRVADDSHESGNPVSDCSGRGR
jgi:hypothetical protein